MKLPYWLIICLLTCSCTNYDTLLYTSQEPITGTLYYNNTELKSGLLVPAAGNDIWLTSSTDTTHYLQKVTTDTKGYFEFLHIPDGSGYTLIADGTQDSVDFHTRIPAPASASALILTLLPVYKNALKITVTNKKGEPWHNVSTFLYRNETVLDSAYAQSAKPEAGFVKSELTNENGIAIYTNLLADITYHVLVFDKLSGTKLRWQEKNITVTKDGFVRRVIVIN